MDWIALNTILVRMMIQEEAVVSIAGAIIMGMEITLAPAPSFIRVWHLMKCAIHDLIKLVNKNFFFQKSLNVKMILGYVKVAEPKYALSFFELALVFEI